MAAAALPKLGPRPLACSASSAWPCVFLLTVAKGLGELGYAVHVLALDAAARWPAWDELGSEVQALPDAADGRAPTVDWLDFDAVVVSSLDAKPVIDSLMLEPFREVPAAWVLHNGALSSALARYAAAAAEHLADEWRPPLA
eukprot:SM006902S21019  [mRNA]  locus=s6902:2:766:- [translate_table: standard]